MYNHTYNYTYMHNHYTLIITCFPDHSSQQGQIMSVVYTDKNKKDDMCMHELT